MTPSTQAWLTSWTLLPGLIVVMLAAGAVYFRGWLRLVRRDTSRFGMRHVFLFVAGLATLYVAVGSPIDAFSYLLLTVHMVQHDLFLFVAPVLLWASRPARPLLAGLPRRVTRFWIAPFLECRWLRLALARVTAPVPAWISFVVVLWAWHLPPLYDLALRAQRWHYLEHAMMFTTAMWFWWPVFRPFPSRREPSWFLVPYLFLAGVQGTVLSGLLTFSDRVLYVHYAAVPRVWGISALTDQAIAGTVMWIPGSIAFLVALAAVVAELMRGRRPAEAPRDRRRGRRRRPIRTAAVADREFDLLRAPLAGPFLRWTHARLVFQIPVFVLGLLVIFDGLTGPQVAPMNLAGVVPWIHWRWFLVVAALVFGNAFCMSCPFVLAGRVGKGVFGGKWAWPEWLKGKRVAIVLMVLFFWAYEAFALWDKPWLTAWIAVAYFVGAVVVDGIFRRAAFCKHICPIGQFNFVQSLISPLEVRIREPDVCRRCRTHDCIKGRRGVPGCQTVLFQPRKRGNMDCTFCLDCVHACPHDNVGLRWHQRSRDLAEDRRRSGIGRVSRRLDLAAMTVLLAFAAFVNAAGMIRPVVDAQQRAIAATGLPRSLIVTFGILTGLIVLPAACVGSAAAVSKRFGGRGEPVRQIAARYAYSLVPLSFSMWLAHYLFHFATSAGAIFPAAQQFAARLGWPGSWLGSFGASGYGVGPAGDGLTKLQLVVLGTGLVGSLYVALRIATSDGSRLPAALWAFLPWAAGLTFMYLVGVWILLEPMQMRGTMMMGAVP